MALRIKGSINGMYHGRLIENIGMASGEVAVAGQGYFLDGGKWSKSSTTNAIEAICIKGGATPVMEIVKAGDLIEADYTGTPNAGFVPGLSAAVLDANGANVNAATVTGGHLRVLNVDEANKKVQVIALKNFTVRDSEQV